MTTHWLYRAATIRRLWFGFAVVLALVVLAELAIERHAHGAIDGSFGFNAWYGLLACVAMIVVARLVGLILKRRDSYYDD